ncbi:MAG: tetraacyldisaccharide 4'-kinase [Rhodobacteraceae bacterium]|nr:MAG: tetraacyldisaccharide 4'-kinase [Paracoccaceae bacterium]
MPRAPGFWFSPKDRPGLLPRLLAPLGWVYAAGTARRLQATGYVARVPVICVGNLTAGGAGKTPTVIALVERLAARGHAVHVVSRGYGGQLQGPVRVEANQHRADQVGDEPLLLSAFAPVWVAKDRAAGVRAAEDAGAGAIVLDDGFQSPAVRPSIGLVVVDAGRGFGNGRCIPAGPLREPVAIGLARADLVLTIGEDSAQAQFDTDWGAMVRVPRLKGSLRPLQMGMTWQGERVLAFAGIADPSRFFATLRAEGADLVRGEALGDHAALSETLLRRLEAEATANGAQLVTTEKDAVRLPPSWQAKVLTLVVRLQIEDWSALDARLGALGL